MTSPSLGEQKALFSGLRIYLAGFEEEAENQFTEEIQAHDGQIAERYNSKCTHVVVCNLTYDNPICVAARKGGKIVVTDSWLLDCLNTDTLVDYSSVLYKPLKDLDGIPGGDDLCICLTGYQGLERKKIMTMVDMMGAKFSKPLISTSVTHLICYKFEGEKYELAHRTPGLMLVNHFWLENCLKAWTILPASDYAQSGLEAETERQASGKDSKGNDGPKSRKKVLGRKSTSNLKKVPASNQISVEKGNVDVHGVLVIEDLKASPNSKQSSAPSSLPGPASGANDAMIPQIDHRLDVSVNINMVVEDKDKGHEVEPPIEDFLVSEAGGISQERNNGLAQHDTNDESTHLYVEDDASNNSCGRSSYQEVHKLSDETAGELNQHNPMNKASAICDAMEVMEVTEENGKRRMSGVQALETNAVSPCKNDNPESPGTKRRRCSQLGSKAEEAPLDKITGISSEESRQLTDGSADKFLSRNLKQGSLCAEDPTVKHDVLASCTAEEISDNRLDTDMEDVIGDCAKLPHEVSEVNEMQSADDFPNCDDIAPINHEGSEIEPGVKAGAQIQDCDSVHVSQDVGDGRCEIGNEEKTIKDTESGHNSPSPIKRSPKSVPSSKTMFNDEKEFPKKKAIAKRSGQKAALTKLAKSYNPNRGRQSNPKQKTTSNKENLTANQINQKEPTKTIIEKSGAIANYETSKVTPAELRCFAVGGSTDQRDRLHSIVKILGGKVSKSRYDWRGEATHVILPDPLRRTEKFLAGAAAGRWILKAEYLEACSEAGKFLDEEPYEWHGEGLNDKGTINLQAPRKWRISKATSGCGAFHGLRILFYGECISPPLGTLKRAIKAGGGLVLATSPPYTRHFTDGVHFAIISPGIPEEDHWVKEFLNHDVACVTSDYFLDTVCHPSSSLEEHILYSTGSAVKAARQSQLGIAKLSKSVQM